MQDTENLKKKLKEYNTLIKDALLSDDYYHAEYYQRQLKLVKERIGARAKNKKMNRKQFKKSNGY